MIITKLQVVPVELDVSSESSCALRLARHSQNAWARHVECVESSRVESSQVEFEPNALLSSTDLRQRHAHVIALIRLGFGAQTADTDSDWLKQGFCFVLAEIKQFLKRLISVFFQFYFNCAHSFKCVPP